MSVARVVGEKGRKSFGKMPVQNGTWERNGRLTNRTNSTFHPHIYKHHVRFYKMFHKNILRDILFDTNNKFNFQISIRLLSWSKLLPKDMKNDIQISLFFSFSFSFSHRNRISSSYSFHSHETEHCLTVAFQLKNATWRSNSSINLTKSYLDVVYNKLW